MKRTKQWWASLTKKERSELHHLDYSNSNWLNRENKDLTKCSYCGNYCAYNWRWLCSKCLNRQKRLIQKANEATLCNS